MKIPWEIIGPAASIVVIVLILVFGFILKFKKLDKTAPVAPSNPPKNSDTLSKISLCFDHEGRISSNTKAVEMACKSIDKYQEQNRMDHGKIFKKMDDLTTTVLTQKTEILQAIKENNG